jgi:hypothetical protein
MSPEQVWLRDRIHHAAHLLPAQGGLLRMRIHPSVLVRSFFLGSAMDLSDFCRSFTLKTGCSESAASRAQRIYFPNL